MGKLKTLHLFAGVGGGLYADLILGHEPIAAVEWDPYACQVLRERAADGWFPGLRVHEGDVRLYDASEYAGRVDVIHAGFPCQDVSAAGKRAGIGEGTRSNLYTEAIRIFREVRPRFLYLENVSAILGGGMLATVMADLAEIGFDEVRWLCLRASDVGANHHRNRWWCLAYSSRIQPGRQEQWTFGKRIREEGQFIADLALPDGERVFGRRSEPGEKEIGRASCAVEGCGHVSDAYGTGLGEQCRTFTIEEKHASPECGRWWLSEPDVGRVANGVSARVNRLKGLGNAQVPLQAAAAWIMLGGPCDVL